MCADTPPGTSQAYGQTIPIFTVRRFFFGYLSQTKLAEVDAKLLDDYLCAAQISWQLYRLNLVLL
jgi:hypothetical protein